MKRTISACPVSGKEQIMLSAPNAELAHCYFTANSWADSRHMVLARLADRKHSHAAQLYLVDIETGEERFLTDQAFWGLYVVQSPMVYHFTEHQIYATHLETGETQLLWTGDLRYRLNGPPSITDDGRYLSVYWELADKSTSINRFDLKTGTMEEVYRVKFPYPFEQASHCMLNPKDSNQMFFCHEGNCCYVTNRLWLADCNTHTARNLFRQKLDADGGNGEPCGHEMWAPDGKGIYFIKYISTTVPPKGVWYYDLVKEEARSIASKFEYWHTAAAPDSLCVTADTQIGGTHSEVVYINPAKQVEEIVAYVRTDWTHPCHPHPQFSPDGLHICYTALGEDGKACVGVVRVGE